MSKPFSLAEAYSAKQQHMLTGLGLMPTFTAHPTTKGDASEQRWIRVLREFLPQRYGVGRVIVIDSRGAQSDQIDIAIYDRQYTPLFFQEDTIEFVPVESIYAICEVKPSMDKANLDYSRAKVESVRRLHRTSAPIRHAGGLFPPQDPASKPILGVFLSSRMAWSSIQNDAASTAILSDDPTPLDLGIAVHGGAFDRTSGYDVAPEGQELIWFATRLFRALSRIGTALAIDLDAYYAPLEAPSPTDP